MICHRCDACRTIIEGDQHRISKALFWISWEVYETTVYRSDGMPIDSAASGPRTEKRLEEIELCEDCMMKMIQAVGYDRITRKIIRDEFEEG